MEAGRQVIIDMLFGRSARARRKRQAAETYKVLVDAARRPEFFNEAGVPDTVDGRFDLVVVHAFLILDRLQWRHGASGNDGDRQSMSKPPGPEEEEEEFSRALFDFMFADMDHSLREMGVGDLGVGKRVRAMGEAFYGRALTYQKALDADDPGLLTAALRRNLFGSLKDVPDHKVTMMADYMTAARRSLREQGSDSIRSAVIAWPELLTHRLAGAGPGAGPVSDGWRGVSNEGTIK